MGLEQHKVYLLLGSNLGDRLKNIKTATELLGTEVGEIICMSSVYETAAWGKEDQAVFLNMAIEIKTSLSPLHVLENILAIEKVIGRIRKEQWGERLIDIDILFYDDDIIAIKEKLYIPHPQMQFRNFVLTPMLEIAGNLIHPVLKVSIEELKKRCGDSLAVVKLRTNN